TLKDGKKNTGELFLKNQSAIRTRRDSARVHRSDSKQSLESIASYLFERNNYSERAKKQKKQLNLPLFPTTTIGSFPQTQAIRTLRQDYKSEKIDLETYTKQIQSHIADIIAIQESIGLDVLVHGEPERNDMVEYFGELLEG